MGSPASNKSKSKSRTKSSDRGKTLPQCGTKSKTNHKSRPQSHSKSHSKSQTKTSGSSGSKAGKPTSASKEPSKGVITLPQCGTKSKTNHKSRPHSHSKSHSKSQTKTSGSSNAKANKPTSASKGPSKEVNTLEQSGSSKSKTTHKSTLTQSRYHSKSKTTTSSSKFEEVIPLNSREVIRSFKVPHGHFKSKDDVVAGFGYSIEKELDRGGFGTVYIVKDNRKHIKVACKWMDLGPTMDDSAMEDTRNELLILEEVCHPYVIKVECYFIVHDPKKYQIYIFMELADGGNLFKHLKKNGLPDELLCKKYFGQILCGIHHMHSLSIAHRDIKPNNVLLVKNERSISGDFVLKVSDFGLSTIVEQDKNKQVVLSEEYFGTPDYMAPELRAEQPYNPYLVDVYALGISLYEIFTLANPFSSESSSSSSSSQNSQLFASVGKWQWPDNGKEKPSQAMTELVQGMLEPDAAKRYSLDKVIFHAWAQSYYEAAHSRSDLFMEEHKQKHKLRQSEYH